MTRSSRAREAASASKAGADPRTAAPACSGMFCASAVSAGHVLAQLRLLLHRPPGEQQGHGGQHGGDERHAEQHRLQSGGVESIAHVVTMSCRVRRAAHEAAACRNCGLSSSVCTLNTGQTSAPRRNAPAR